MQEEQHDDAGQHDALEQRAHHAIELLLRILRLNVDDVEVDVRELRAHARQRGQHVVRRIDLRGVRGLLNLKEQTVDAVDRAVLAARFVTCRYRADIANAQHGAR